MNAARGPRAVTPYVTAISGHVQIVHAPDYLGHDITQDERWDEIAGGDFLGSAHTHFTNVAAAHTPRCDSPGSTWGGLPGDSSPDSAARLPSARGASGASSKETRPGWSPDGS